MKKNTMNILSFNMWDGGIRRNVSIDDYVSLINKYEIDYACLQECNILDEKNQIITRVGEEISKKLGWNYYEQKTKGGYATSVLSKTKSTKTYDFKGTSESYSGEKALMGIEFEESNSNKILIINDHLQDEPYQPYDFIKNINTQNPQKLIKDNIESAKETRSKDYLNMLDDILGKQTITDIPIFLTADFNEPSYLDWTKESFDNKQCPFEVEWPTSKGISIRGFHDSFRTIYKNPITSPGISWSLAQEDKGLRFDRIDFIYYKNAQLIDIQIINTGLSDHAALVATFIFK